MEKTKNLKENLIKTLEKRRKSLEKTLKDTNEKYAEDKKNIFQKLEVVDLQLSGLKNKK